MHFAEPGAERRRRLVPAAEHDPLADVGADPVEPVAVEVGADVVEQGSRYPIGREGRDDHRHQPAERGADEYRAVDRQFIEQLQDVRRVGGRHVIARLWVVGALAAAAEIRRDHPPLAGVAVGQRLEIARIAGQAVQAQQRRPVGRAGIVAVVELQAVAARPVLVAPCGHARFPLRCGSPIAIRCRSRNPIAPTAKSRSLAGSSTIPSAPPISRSARQGS